VSPTPEDFANAGDKLDAEAGLAEHIGIIAARLELEAAYYTDEGTLAVVETCREAAALLRNYRQVLLSEKGESDPLGEQPTYFEMARTKNMRKRIADIVATHDAFVADSKNPARAYELRDAINGAREIGLTRAEMMEYQDYDCPHAAPHRYCETCKVDPCPLGFKHKDHRSNERT